MVVYVSGKRNVGKIMPERGEGLMVKMKKEAKCPTSPAAAQLPKNIRCLLLQANAPLLQTTRCRLLRRSRQFRASELRLKGFGPHLGQRGVPSLKSSLPVTRMEGGVRPLVAHVGYVVLVAGAGRQNTNDASVYARLQGNVGSGVFWACRTRLSVVS